MAVDSMVSKIDHTPLLRGRDASRSTSNACPSDGDVRAGTGAGAGPAPGAGARAGVGAAAGGGGGRGGGGGFTSGAAPAAATVRMDKERRTADLKRPWAH